MSTQEDRITALEQNTVSRIDFINSINRISLQHAQHSSDMSHQVTILLGVVGSQGQDIRTIKEDISVIKEDVSTIKGRLSSLETRIGSLETKFDQHTTLLTQILARLPEKS